MIEITKTEICGFEAAIRGMRNPMNSWEMSDSKLCRGSTGFEDCTVNAAGKCPRCENFENDVFCIGKNDYQLMKKLVNAGTDHRKFMRMIIVYADVNAPLYFWKEYDTYKVGTVANSCSTMHKIQAKEFELDDFSHEHLVNMFVESLPYSENEMYYCNAISFLENTISVLNCFRYNYLLTKDKLYWWQMIQLLPSSYNQKRTLMLNYEVLANIYHSRKNHKLDEWIGFCKWIEILPYSELITGEQNERTNV